MWPGRSGDDEFQRVLAAAQAGDHDAFGVLWRVGNPSLVRFLTGLTDREDAEDLASTVWMEVGRGLDRFVGDEAGFRAWVFTIARHRVIDLRRSRARRPPPAGGAAEAAEERPGDGPDPATAAEDTWSTDAAVALIGTLPPDQAEVLLLRVVADLDVATVAKLLGKRPGAVRVLAHRGLRRLAEQLGRDGEPIRDVTR